MSLSVDLPPDLEQAALDIPDLNKRLAAFLRHQVDLEAWRCSRGSARARELVERGFAQGDALKAHGLSHEEAFAMFEELHGRITEGR